MEGDYAVSDAALLPDAPGSGHLIELCAEPDCSQRPRSTRRAISRQPRMDGESVARGAENVLLMETDCLTDTGKSDML